MDPFEPSFSPDICPGVGLLNHTATLFLAFWGTSILFCRVAAPVCIPTNSIRGWEEPCLDSLPSRWLPALWRVSGLWLHDPVSASSHRDLFRLWASPPLCMRTSVIQFRACPDPVWPYCNLITSNSWHWREMEKKQTHFQVSLHSPAHILGSECITWGRPSLTHSALFFQVFAVWLDSPLPYGRYFFLTFHFVYAGHTGSSLFCAGFF